MRLRLLGTTQSIEFFSPPEVHQSILDVCSKVSGAHIDSHDVIHWLLEQTCSGLEQLQPLHYTQGIDYCRRQQAATNNPSFLSNADQRENLLEALRNKEHRTLIQLYQPAASGSESKSVNYDSTLKGYVQELETRRRGFQDTGNAVQASALQEVEQEREVAFEVEAVREIQVPVHYSPQTFPGTHQDIVNFATTGRLVDATSAYESALTALGRTSTGGKHDVRAKAAETNLYFSTEFMKTIRHAAGELLDSNFVVSIPSSNSISDTKLYANIYPCSAL